MNGDGAADVVCASAASLTVRVHLGNLTGALASWATFGTAQTPTSLALADFNGDGILDLAASEWNDRIETWRGNGDGTFQPPQTLLVTGTLPSQVIAVDIESNGVCDLVSANYASPAVRFYQGNGLGAFALSSSFDVVPQATTIAVMNLTNDGLADFAIGGALPSLSLLLFSSSILGWGGTYYSIAGVGAMKLAVANFDGDPLEDVVAVRLGANQVDLVKNFSLLGATFSTVPLAGPAHDVVVGDFTRDGNTDFAVSKPAQNDCTLAVGNGSGVFGVGSYAAGSAPWGLAAADLDADGRLDLVAASEGSAQLSTLLNQLAPSASTSSYGAGTTGCWGRSGMATNGAPHIDNPNFRFHATNVPANALGLCLVADVAMVPYFDPFGLGIWLHLDVFAANDFLGFDFYSDRGRTAAAPVPLPNAPLLIGKTFYAQGIWVESAGDGLSCSSSPYPLSSTRGVAFTLLPPFAP